MSPFSAAAPRPVGDIPYLWQPTAQAVAQSRGCGAIQASARIDQSRGHVRADASGLGLRLQCECVRAGPVYCCLVRHGVPVSVIE
ncbi:hypothetical protein GCM10017688_39080 [Streptomyces ramulosus]